MKRKFIQVFEDYKKMNEGATREYHVHEESIWEVIDDIKGLEESHLPILFPDKEKYDKYVGTGWDDDSIAEFNIYAEVEVVSASHTPATFNPNTGGHPAESDAEYSANVYIEAFDDENEKEWSEQKAILVKMIKDHFEEIAEQKANEDSDLFWNAIDAEREARSMRYSDYD